MGVSPADDFGSGGFVPERDHIPPRTVEDGVELLWGQRDPRFVAGGAFALADVVAGCSEPGEHLVNLTIEVAEKAAIHRCPFDLDGCPRESRRLRS
jgi:hypothetical protein